MKFEIGQRVRVYHLQCAFSSQVSAINEVGHLQVWEDFDSHHMWVSPKQCRRLKPRPKQPKKRTPIYLTVSRDVHGAWYVQNCESHAGAKIPADGVQVRFCEAIYGHVTISREDLRAGYKQADLIMQFSANRTTDTWFEALCKALGLEEGEG